MQYQVLIKLNKNLNITHQSSGSESKWESKLGIKISDNIELETSK